MRFHFIISLSANSNCQWYPVKRRQHLFIFHEIQQSISPSDTHISNNTFSSCKLNFCTSSDCVIYETCSNFNNFKSGNIKSIIYSLLFLRHKQESDNSEGIQSDKNWWIFGSIHFLASMQPNSCCENKRY